MKQAAVDKLQVGIFVFDDVEVLDFAGPFEVFSRTRLAPGLDSRRSDETAPCRVFTIAAQAGPIAATGGLQIVPDCDFAAQRPVELLIVPGGFGARQLLQNDAVLDWIRRTAGSARQVASVCTGALLLARAGLLSGRRATTHWGALDLLASLDPSIQVERTRRVVEDGIITSAGVSAGIDMALTLVGNLWGGEVAEDTARYMEYPRPATQP
jgi:transcriptional regulator GlxA family with amidase domain